jgi:transcription initiation factor TFIID subunit 6
MHWLAIDGVQPAIKENPSSEDIEERKRRIKTGSENERVEHKAQVKHLLSKEMQLYYETVVNSVFVGDEKHRSIIFHSLAYDSGLNQLIPYFSKFVADTVPSKVGEILISLFLDNIIIDFCECM